MKRHLESAGYRVNTEDPESLELCDTYEMNKPMPSKKHWKTRSNSSNFRYGLDTIFKGTYMK